MPGLLRQRGLRRRRVVLGAAFLTLVMTMPGEHPAGAGPDRSIVVGEHAAWSRDCQGIASPPLFVVAPPQNGSLCERPQEIRIASMYAGTEAQCIGHHVSGITLVYRPNQGFVGKDALVYVVQYPTRLRRLAVEVTVETTAPTKASVAEAEPIVTAAQARPLSTQIPICAMQIF